VDVRGRALLKSHERRVRTLAYLLDDDPVADKRYGDPSPNLSGETTGRNLVDSAEAGMLVKIEDESGTFQIFR